MPEEKEEALGRPLQHLRLVLLTRQTGAALSNDPGSHLESSEQVEAGVKLSREDARWFRCSLAPNPIENAEPPAKAAAPFRSFLLRSTDDPGTRKLGPNLDFSTSKNHTSRLQ